MKKLIVLFALILSSNYNVYSQSGWFWHNPMPQGNDLYDVFVINNTGYPTGSKGAIIKTTDGGRAFISGICSQK